MLLRKEKVIKFTKNIDIIVDKLDKVQKIYGINTRTKVIEYLCDVAIESCNAFYSWIKK